MRNLHLALVATALLAACNSMPSEATPTLEQRRSGAGPSVACLARLDAARLPHVPVRLLIRGEFRGLEAGAFDAASRQLAADWARRLRIDGPTVVEGSGHDVQRDKPNIVAGAIASTVAAKPGRDARS